MSRDPPAALIAAACLAGAAGVAVGTFGAHAAPGPREAELLRTAGQYLMLHAAAALAVAAFVTNRIGRIAAFLMLGGAAIFAVALTGLALGGPRFLGAVAPLGGLGMIAGWLVAAAAGLRR